MCYTARMSLAVSLVLVAAVVPALGPSPKFLRDAALTKNWSLGRPTGIQVTSDGSAVLFLRSPPRDPTRSLYEFDVATGKTRELLTPEALLHGAQEHLSVAERARRERERSQAAGFNSFQLSQDGKTVVVTLSGQLYALTRATGATRQLTRGSDSILTPRISPDGEYVAYVKGNDVFVTSLVSGRTWQTTRGGTATITHGLAEFVAEEEMQRFSGFWWSPDSRSIAFEEADSRGVERFTIADPAHPERPANVFPYPRPGKANVQVRLGITGLRGGHVTWVRWDRKRYPYLARVMWKVKAAPLTILVQARDQKTQRLLAVDARTGRTRLLLQQTDDAWLNLYPDVPAWLPDGSGFVYDVDDDYGRELMLMPKSGKDPRVIVPPSVGFQRLVHLPRTGNDVYVLVAETPTNVQLARASLDGGEPQTLYREGASSEHQVVFSRDGSVYVDTRVTAGAMAQSTVYRIDGTGTDSAHPEQATPTHPEQATPAHPEQATPAHPEQATPAHPERSRGTSVVGILPSVAEAPPFRPNVELTTVRGERDYEVAIIRPRSFDPKKKYPVIDDVYGGPGYTQVHASEADYLLDQWIADHGVIVVCIDGRGTPRRGRLWERAIAGSFGEIPLHDQVDALHALGAAYHELDLSRAGIYGWSFGGYLAALAVMRRPDVFQVAVAGAPVVDWHDYDTHYTERYLGLPSTNEKGYDQSSLLTYAAKLSRPLLIIHGTADDNVYFLHSLKLAHALFAAGRPFDFLPLSGTHMVADPETRARLWQRVADFLLPPLGVGTVPRKQRY